MFSGSNRSIPAVPLVGGSGGCGGTCWSDNSHFLGSGFPRPTTPCRRAFRCEFYTSIIADLASRNHQNNGRFCAKNRPPPAALQARWNTLELCNGQPFPCRIPPRFRRECVHASRDSWFNRRTIRFDSGSSAADKETPAATKTRTERLKVKVKSVDWNNVFLRDCLAELIAGRRRPGVRSRSKTPSASPSTPA